MIRTALLLALLMVCASAFQLNMVASAKPVSKFIKPAAKSAPAPAKPVSKFSKPAAKSAPAPAKPVSKFSFKPAAKSAPAPAPAPAKPVSKFIKPAAKSAPAPAKPVSKFSFKPAAAKPVAKPAAPVKTAALAPVKKVAPVPVKKATPVPPKKVVAAPAPPKKVVAAPAPPKRVFASSNSDLPAIFLTGYPSGKIDATGKVAYRSSFAGGLVGADVEAGEFDPFKLAQGVSSETLEWYRAAELKHGRVSMLAALGIIVASAVTINPFTGPVGSLAGLAKLYEERPAAVWQVVTALAAVEVSTLFFKTSGEAGDLGFDPLNFKAKYGLEDPSKFDVMRLKELKNGRLAMIMTLGLLAQEAVTGKGVF